MKAGQTLVKVWCHDEQKPAGISRYDGTDTDKQGLAFLHLDPQDCAQIYAMERWSEVANAGQYIDRLGTRLDFTVYVIDEYGKEHTFFVRVGHALTVDFFSKPTVPHAS